MRMTRIALPLAIVAIVASSQLGHSESEPTGKDLFAKYRCNSCHTIKTEGIAKKAAADEEKEKEGDRKPPDLSTVGKERTAVWMTKYLLKLEKIDGETHSKKFRGTEGELKTLSVWLETLKTAPKKGK